MGAWSWHSHSVDREGSWDKTAAAKVGNGKNRAGVSSAANRKGL